MKNSKPHASNAARAESEKQERILVAAMSEFCKGFRSASTDEIVQKAGISKGLLFHYFGSKRKLLDSVAEMSMDIIENKYLARIDMSNRDLLQRLLQISVLKIEVMLQYPSVFNFLASLYTHRAEPECGEVLAHLLEECNASLQLSQSGIFRDIDVSLFRDDIDKQRAIDSISWTVQGYAERVLAKFSSRGSEEILNTVLHDLEEYMNLFRMSFYKMKGN